MFILPLFLLLLLSLGLTGGQPRQGLLYHSEVPQDREGIFTLGHGGSLIESIYTGTPTRDSAALHREIVGSSFYLWN